MILIDGYNLLHVTGLSGPEISRGEIGRGALARARAALLRFLANSLKEDERQLTTVAFDSNETPPGMPSESQQHGITVRYATEHESADELLEELISKASAPRKLTVVSSDHRVQRAAKRRKARAVDSDVWYAEILDLQRETRKLAAPDSCKPTSPLSEEEVAAWLYEFGEVSLEQGSPVSSVHHNDDAPSVATPIENPFPPGYAEDLLEDNQ